MRKKLSTISFPIIILTLITSNVILASCTSPELTLTIQTDKARYDLGETLTLNGTLTKDYAPVADALVAIQIKDPAGESFIYRTLNTGTEPQLNWMIEILEVTPSDELGNPKTNFKRGQAANFKVTVRNNGAESKHVVLVLNCYYLLSHETTFKATLYFQGSIPPGTPIPIVPQIVIPDDAPICTAKVYANAYTKLPENLGYAYCPEKSATFTITDSTTFSSTTSSQTMEYTSHTLDGTYNLTFNLPRKNIRVGNYTLYASTFYQLEQVLAYTTFEVILIGDINGDKIVDIFDAVLLAKAAGSTPGDPNWDHRCDLNSDGIVDIFDAVLLASNAGKTAL